MKMVHGIYTIRSRRSLNKNFVLRLMNSWIPQNLLNLKVELRETLLLTTAAGDILIFFSEKIRLIIFRMSRLLKENRMPCATFA